MKGYQWCPPSPLDPTRYFVEHSSVLLWSTLVPPWWCCWQCPPAVPTNDGRDLVFYSKLLILPCNHMFRLWKSNTYCQWIFLELKWKKCCLWEVCLLYLLYTYVLKLCWLKRRRLTLSLFSRKCFFFNILVCLGNTILYQHIST